LAALATRLKLVQGDRVSSDPSSPAAIGSS
jgi:hypothetical protein